MDFLKDVFGSGMNIFGASTPQNTQRMIDAGLLAPDAGEKAQSQSLMRGLLGTAVSYASQPRTGGYNSWVPYAGKAFAQGMEQAQQPMDNMYDRAKQNHAMNQIAEEKMAKDNKAKFDSGLYQPNSVVNGLQRQDDPRLEREDQNGNITKVGPNFNPITQTQRPAWNSEKYLRDSLDNGLIDSDEYFKYKQLLNPTTDPVNVAAGGALVDPNTGEEIYKNPKNQLEKASNDFRVWNEMGGKANQRFPTFTKYNEWLKENGGVNVNTNVNTGDPDGDSPYIKKELDKLFVDTNNEALSTGQNMADLEQMMRYMEQAGETGGGAEGILGAKKLANRLGFEFDEEGLGAQEAMRSLSNKLALAMRKPGSGVMTDKDFQVFLDSNPSLGNTYAGNMRMIKYAMDSHKSRQELAKRIRTYKRGTKGMYGNTKAAGKMDDGIYDFVNDYWVEVAERRRTDANLGAGLDASGNFSDDAFKVKR